MTTSSVFDEIRRVRHAMSAEIGHDPRRIVGYFAAIQKKNAQRVVNLADQGPLGRTKDRTEVADSAVSDGESSPATR